MSEKPHPNASWATHVGRFVLAFGDIEHMVTLCLQFLPNDSIGESCASLPLGARLNFLEEILSPSQGALRQELLGVVKRIRIYVERRNLIAHNGLQFNVYKDGERLTISQEIVSSRNKAKSISYSELITLADQVSELALDLTNVGVEVIQDERPDLLDVEA